MDKLKKLETQLSNREAFQIDVLDVATEKVVDRAINQAHLNNLFGGSLKNYLESLNKRGMQVLQLTPRLKYGSSTRSGGAVVTVDFTQKPQTQNNMTLPQTQMQPQYSAPSGLNGALGLGMPEMLEGLSARRENEILKQQLEELRRDLRAEKESKALWQTKAQELQLTNKVFEVQQSTEREPSALDRIIEGLANNPASIPALIGAFKGGAPALNAPAVVQPSPYAQYSDIQAAVCDLVGQLPDPVCEDIVTLITRIFDNDQKFNSDLKKLINSNQNG